MDEIEGVCGFPDPGGDKNFFSWPQQPGATVYDVARSPVPDFSMGCSLTPVTTAFWEDGETPALGGGFYYLVRATAPNPGSWGSGSSGERMGICP